MEAVVSFNLATMLTETAMATPDATAYTFMGATTSYRELDEQSGRIAAGLLGNGMTPGQVVALQLPNLPHFPAAYFGALKAGLTVLPLNPLLKAPEIAYHLADAAAAIMIGFDSRKPPKPATSSASRCIWSA
jgi:long-chain acyl-CoA synthetase